MVKVKIIEKNDSLYHSTHYFVTKVTQPLQELQRFLKNNFFPWYEGTGELALTIYK